MQKMQYQLPHVHLACSWKTLEHVKIEGSPNSERDRALVRSLLSPNEAFNTGLLLNELLAKEAPLGTPPKTQTIVCSPQTESETPLLEKTPTQFIKHGEVKLVPTSALSLIF